MKIRMTSFGIDRIILLIILPLLFTAFSLERKVNNNSIKKSELSAGASALIKAAFEGIDSTKLIDIHVHVFGTGIGNTGNFVNEKMLTIKHFSDYFKFKMYLSAANIKDMKNVDDEYIERLKELAFKSPTHGKFSILAFDKNYNYDGTVNLSKTEFYVPNEYVFSLAEKNPELFIPVISVHPYRKDALDELTKFAKRGGKMVKWLPNAMGIDPSDVKCEPFYKKMKELHLVLLSHTGMELAVEAKEDQRYGNPLLLKKPLDMGVKVIMAHCASLGESTDLEDPTKKMVNNFDLFIRLMGNKKYEGLLFADISALTQINRSGEPLKTMLHRTDLQYRLVNGSDYPLPAVDIVISLNKLILSKYITKQEADYLSDIYKYNPLLFDFVLKRTLKDPETGKHFLTTIFMRNNDLEN